MAKNRRDFLKAAGYAVLGASGAAPFVLTNAFGSSREGAKSAPGGRRWALFIDTEKCARNEGCEKCIEACHATHNVPHTPDDPAEDVKWIWKESAEHVFSDEVHERLVDDLKHRETLVLCNHCDNPPCVRVCPTQATFKRDDGVVMMDQHRCIGCRYCMVGCPYGARSFNWKDPRKTLEKLPGREINPSYPTRTKGVVEKCTLCSEVIARASYEELRSGSKAPHCVRACPHGAIVFGDLNDKSSDIYKKVREHYFTRRKAMLGTKPQVYYSL